MPHRHDELLPDRDIKQLGPKRLPRKRPDLGKEVVTDRWPATVRVLHGCEIRG